MGAVVAIVLLPSAYEGRGKDMPFHVHDYGDPVSLDQDCRRRGLILEKYDT